MVVHRIVLTWIAFVSLTTIGTAHPGHGSNSSGDSFIHYATSPVHFLPVVFAAILLAGIGRVVCRCRQTPAAKASR